MVLVAGDARMPDQAYLKGFREDVLVLIGAELVLPTSPLDQTKKKAKPDEAKAAPVPRPVPLPALQPPPVLVRPAVIKPPVLPAPAVEKAAPMPDVQKR